MNTKRLLAFSWIGLASAVLSSVHSFLIYECYLCGAWNVMLVQGAYYAFLATSTIFWLGYGFSIPKSTGVVKFSALICGIATIVQFALFASEQHLQLYFNNARTWTNLAQLTGMLVFFIMFLIKSASWIRVGAILKVIFLISALLMQYIYIGISHCMLYIAYGCTITFLLSAPFYIALIVHQIKILRSPASRCGGTYMQQNMDPLGMGKSTEANAREINPTFGRGKGYIQFLRVLSYVLLVIIIIAGIVYADNLSALYGESGMPFLVFLLSVLLALIALAVCMVYLDMAENMKTTADNTAEILRHLLKLSDSGNATAAGIAKIACQLEEMKNNKKE